MKVLLDPEQASRENVLRFIEEAQITGQLQHPSIVPLYELGVDTSGNVFYTMKFVQGVTLKDIIEKIKEGDKEAIEEFPLARLLNVFQRICDAIAFAHSKGVIHRDLKPENVMIGEYGEVLVMDWGLAKVLSKQKQKKAVAKGKEHPEKKPGIQEVIDSVRKDAGTDLLKTMDGTVMGTPAFMAPEQALGETESLDERTDIYALGAILYNILTLNPPVTGKDVYKILAKVTNGNIPHPSGFNPTGSKRSAKKKGLKDLEVAPLNHCPKLRIPDSLSAVVMKALALKQIQRYESVKALQKEIQAYQGGFATSAEEATLWKQVKLLVNRHKAVSSMAASILLLVTAASIVSTGLWLRSRAAEKEAVETGRQASEALAALQGTAPAMAVQARKHLENVMPVKALAAIEDAITFASDKEGYILQKAHILQCMLRLKRADAAYRKILETDPENRSAQINSELCRKLIKDSQGKTIPPVLSICEFYKALRDQGRQAGATVLVSVCSNGGRNIRDFWTFVFEQNKIKPTAVKYDNDGLVSHLQVTGASVTNVAWLKGMPLTTLNLAKTRVTDLSPLRGMLLTSLDIYATKVTDLSPLKGIKLTSLNMGMTQVTDLSPLTSMRLTFLVLRDSPVADLSVAAGMPLTELDLRGTQVTDLSPLKGMALLTLCLPDLDIADLSPLRNVTITDYLNIEGTKVADLSPLKGTKLRRLSMRETVVTDLTPLRGLDLKVLDFEPGRIEKGIDVILEMTSFETACVYPRSDPRHKERYSAAEIVKRYNAGEFNK